MCPDCESGEAWALDAGRDAEDRIVRLRQCKQCGLEYSTVEVPVVDSRTGESVSYYRMDVRRIDYNRQRRREKHGVKQVQRHLSEPPEVIVTVKVRDKHRRARPRTRG